MGERILSADLPKFYESAKLPPNCLNDRIWAHVSLSDKTNIHLSMEMINLADTMAIFKYEAKLPSSIIALGDG